MKTSSPFAVLVCLFLSPFAAVAQQAPSPSSSTQQALAVLQKSLSAMTNGIAVTDAAFTGSARRLAGTADETGTVEARVITNGAKSRLNLSLPSGQWTETRNLSNVVKPGTPPPQIVSGQAISASHAGSWSGPDGVVHLEADHNLLTDTTWFFPAALIQRLTTSQDYVVSDLGEQTTNGTSLIHVQAYKTPASGMPSALAEMAQRATQIDILLDATTFLPIAFDFNTHPDNNARVDIPVEIRFSGYRANAGAQVPFHVQKFKNRALVLDLQFDSAAINSGVSADLFEIQ